MACGGKGSARLLAAVVLALGAYLLQTRTATLLLLELTDAFGGAWPLTRMDACPAPDVEAFRAKLLPTPRVAVSSMAECFQVGDAMGHPLICEMPDQNEERLAEVAEAVRSDPTTYTTICRDGDDAIHFLTPYHHGEGTIESVLAEPGNCGASFIYGDAHEAVLHEVLPYLAATYENSTDHRRLHASGVAIGTSFASNFPRARISTASHAATVTSIAYQLAGRKVWLLHDHEESAADYYVGFPAWYAAPSCLDPFLKGLQRPFVAVTRPGDALYFPLAYMHAVITDAGPNVMTNVRLVRKPGFKGLFSRFSAASIVKLLGSKLMYAAGARANPRAGILHLGHVKWKGASAATRSAAEIEANAEIRSMLGNFLET